MYRTEINKFKTRVFNEPYNNVTELFNMLSPKRAISGALDPITETIWNRKRRCLRDNEHYEKIAFQHPVCASMLSSTVPRTFDTIDHHPLLPMGRKEIMTCPLQKHLMDTCLNLFVFRKSDFGTTTSSSFLCLPSKYDNNVRTLLATFCPASSQERDPSTDSELFYALKDPKVQEFLNWLRLVHKYVSDNDMKIEPFQKIMLMHATIFLASVFVPQHRDMARILCEFFQVNECQLEQFKHKTASFIIMRRQGKTTFAKIILATCVLTVKNCKLAYFANTLHLVDVVMNEIMHIVEHMMSGVNASKVEKSEGTIVVHFPNGDQSTIVGKSYANKNVSIYIFVSLLGWNKYVGNRHVYISKLMTRRACSFHKF